MGGSNENPDAVGEIEEFPIPYESGNSVDEAEAEDEKASLLIRMPQDVKAKLYEAARRPGKSMNSYVVDIIEGKIGKGAMSGGGISPDDADSPAAIHAGLSETLAGFTSFMTAVDVSDDGWDRIPAKDSIAFESGLSDACTAIRKAMAGLGYAASRTPSRSVLRREIIEVSAGMPPTAAAGYTYSSGRKLVTSYEVCNLVDEQAKGLPLVLDGVEMPIAEAASADSLLPVVLFMATSWLGTTFGDGMFRISADADALLGYRVESISIRHEDLQKSISSAFAHLRHDGAVDISKPVQAFLNWLKANGQQIRPKTDLELWLFERA